MSTLSMMVGGFMVLITAVVAVYYRRKDFADSRLGRRILATSNHLLRWRSEAHVVKELAWLGKFFGATALLCFSITLLGDQVFGASMPHTLTVALYAAFAGISIYAVLDPHRLFRKLVRETSAMMVLGPGAFLLLDVMTPGAATLPGYAALWHPFIDFSGFHGIELAARIAFLHASLCAVGFVFYGLMLAFIPALLYTALSGSKRLCSTVLNLSDEAVKDLMVACFLLVTLYGAASIATR